MTAHLRIRDQEAGEDLKSYEEERRARLAAEAEVARLTALLQERGIGPAQPGDR